MNKEKKREEGGRKRVKEGGREGKEERRVSNHRLKQRDPNILTPGQENNRLPILDDSRGPTDVKKERFTVRGVWESVVLSNEEVR